MIQRTEIGKRCREYFLEVERRYKEQYSERNKALTPAEFLLEQAKMLVEQERRMTAVESKVSNVENNVLAVKTQVDDLETKFESKLNQTAGMTTGMDWYTITGYIALNHYRVNPNDYGKLGKAAARLSREKGYPIGQAPHSSYGHVGVYSSDILREVFIGMKRNGELMGLMGVVNLGKWRMEMQEAIQEYFTSVLRYAYHNNISIDLNRAKFLFKKAQALSRERDYNVFNVTKKGMTGTEILIELAKAKGVIKDTKDSNELKKLVTTIFHSDISDILKEAFNNYAEEI